jgi:hypothetical protein
VGAAEVVVTTVGQPARLEAMEMEARLPPKPRVTTQQGVKWPGPEVILQGAYEDPAHRWWGLQPRRKDGGAMGGKLVGGPLC